MRIWLVLAVCVFSPLLWATKPSIGEITYRSLELECPPGRSCVTPDESFCSDSNTEIFPNDDNTFDIVFNNFNVKTTSSQDYGHAGCRLDLSVNIPPRQQLTLKEVSIGGGAVVPDGGRSVQ